MEIALLNPNSIRIKGKQGSIIVNPAQKVPEANGFIVFGGAKIDHAKVNEGSVIISGPGEYEFSGIKVTGVKNGNETAYSIRVDRVEILLGIASVLEKEYSKLQEHNLVLLYTDAIVDASFVTSLATNIIMLYGEKAEETFRNFAKDGYKTETKYSVTYDKLPLEVEKILLQ